MNKKYQDVLDYPKKYKGCPLCLGRQTLWKLCDTIGTSMGDIICPECEGLGVVLIADYEEERA